VTASARTYPLLRDEVKSPFPSLVPPTKTEVHFYFHVNLKIVLPIGAGAAATTILAIIAWVYNKNRNIRANQIQTGSESNVHVVEEETNEIFQAGSQSTIQLVE
jgi:hypothetical protein